MKHATYFTVKGKVPNNSLFVSREFKSLSYH